MIKKFFLLALILLTVSLIVIYFLVPKEQPSLKYKISSELNLSNSYKIFFVKDSRGLSGDGAVFEIFSIKSDGSDLKFEKKISSEVWFAQMSRSVKDGEFISESMGNYTGNLTNSDGSKQLFAKSPIGGMFFPFRSKLYLKENGNTEFLAYNDNFDFGSFVWISDSDYIVFSGNNKIGVIDIQTKIFTYLTDGAGWLIVENDK